MTRKEWLDKPVPEPSWGLGFLVACLVAFVVSFAVSIAGSVLFYHFRYGVPFDTLFRWLWEMVT